MPLTPLELLLYLVALAAGLIPVGIVVTMMLSVNRADRRRQDGERRKAGTLAGPR